MYIRSSPVVWNTQYKRCEIVNDDGVVDYVYFDPIGAGPPKVPQVATPVAEGAMRRRHRAWLVGGVLLAAVLAAFAASGLVLLPQAAQPAAERSGP